jgi:hemolysin activation/secretion protein
VKVEGRVFPNLWDVESTFGEVHGHASTYLTAGGVPLQPTLALRAGGKKVWGDYPFQEAAFIGDARTVRLGRQNRYAGDAAVYGNAELRLDVGRVFLLLPARFGVFGLGDVGRVFLEGETSSTWHWAAGGGVWIAFLGRPNTLSLALAQSEDKLAVYVSGGFAF